MASAVPIEPLPPGPNGSSITLGGAPPTAPLPPLPSPSPGGGDSGGEYDGASDADMEEFEAVIEGRIEENGPLGLMLCDTRSPAGYSHVHVNSVTPDGEAARAVPGLVAGMVLVTVDGDRVSTYEQVLEKLQWRPVTLGFAYSPFELPEQVENVLAAKKIGGRLAKLARKRQPSAQGHFNASAKGSLVVPSQLPEPTSAETEGPTPRATFNRFDLDRDGRLNEVELSGLLEACGLFSDVVHTRRALEILSE